MRKRDLIEIFIAEYSILHGGNSPSLQEIADNFRICKTTAHTHVMKLHLEGRACRRDGKLWLPTADVTYLCYLPLERA